MAEHNYYRKSKKARKACVGILLSLLVQMLLTDIADFWQVGSCAGGISSAPFSASSGCFWKDGLPWTATQHNSEGKWILVLALGVVALIFMLVSLLMLVVEMFWRKKMQDHMIYNIILWVFILFAGVCWVLQWILYLVFSWPLKGFLSFCFVGAILSTVITIVVLIVLFYGNRWRQLHLQNREPEKQMPPQ